MPAYFASSAIRFMRDKWGSVQELAEEIFAVLRSTEFGIPGPIKILQSDDGQPPVQIVMNPAGDVRTPAIEIKRGGSTTNIGGINNGDLTFGGITFGDINLGGPFTPPPPPAPPPGTEIPNIQPEPPPGLDPGPGGPGMQGLDWPGLDPDDRQQAIPPQGEFPIPLWGVVVGKVSPGVYEVRCWLRSPLKYPPVGVLNVRQGLIDPDEGIPAGTPTLVIAYPGIDENNRRTIIDAVMQVPVWLG